MVLVMASPDAQHGGGRRLDDALKDLTAHREVQKLAALEAASRKREISIAVDEIVADFLRRIREIGLTRDLSAGLERYGDTHGNSFDLWCIYPQLGEGRGLGLLANGSWVVFQRGPWVQLVAPCGDPVGFLLDQLYAREDPAGTVARACASVLSTDYPPKPTPPPTPPPLPPTKRSWRDRFFRSADR